MKCSRGKQRYALSALIILIIFISIGSGFNSLQKPPKEPRGIRVTLKMNIPDYLLGLSKKKDESFCSIMNKMSKEMSRNPKEDVFNVLRKEFSEKKMSLSDYFGFIEKDGNKLLAGLKEISNDALDQNIEILTRRINSYLDITPRFQKQQYWRLEIIIPFKFAGKEEAGSQVYELMRKTGLWEFRSLKSKDSAFSILTKIDKILGGTGYRDSSGNKSIYKRKKIRTKEELEKMHPILRLILPDSKRIKDDVYTTESGKKKIIEFLKKPEVQEIIPPGEEIVFGSSKRKGLHRVNYSAKASGISIEDVLVAECGLDQNTGTPLIIIQLNQEASLKAEEITKSGNRIAAMLDGELYLSPGGEKPEPGIIRIEGFENIEEAKAASVFLKSGPLAAPMKLYSIGWVY